LARQNRIVLWEVDTQVDFMLPHGKLYVPGAEKLIPNINRLVDCARSGNALLLSSGCHHVEDDPEFQDFKPHCIRGTEGAKFIPEALAHAIAQVPNDPRHRLPADLLSHHQILFEKQTLDVFKNTHTAPVVDALPAEAEFFVFGVVTEHCVRCAGKGLLERGRKVSVITDAIETLDAAVGRKTIEELSGYGAKLISTQEAVAKLHSASLHA